VTLSNSVRLKGIDFLGSMKIGERWQENDGTLSTPSRAPGGYHAFHFMGIECRGIARPVPQG
jgi:hypothetical protein